MSGPIEVAICFDRNLEEPALVFLASLRARTNSARDLIVHVVTSGLSPSGEASLAKLTRRGFTIDLIKVANTFAEFESLGHISSGTYLRFLLPELLPACDKILYLDVDLIVHRDITELFDTSLDGLALAAVPDFSQLNSGLTWRPWRIDHQGKAFTFADYLKSVLSLDPSAPRPYFNCGVMLLDLAIWRAERIVEKTIEILRQKPGLRFLDQDALNHVVGTSYKVLDARWNVLAANTGPLRLHWLDRWTSRGRAWLAVRRLWREDPWIIHFAGPAKPWQDGTDPTPLDSFWWEAATELHAATEGSIVAAPRPSTRLGGAVEVPADAD